MREALARRDDAEAALFRREMGLPTDAPVVMTGHQPEFWRPGVAAKFIACDEASKALGAAPAWVCVDHDEGDPLTVKLPARGADERGVERALEQDARFGPSPLDIPMASAPASPVDPGLWSAKGEAAQRIARALAKSANEASLARQVWTAATALLEDSTGIRHAPTVFGSEVCRSSLFASLWSRMAESALACAEAYNAAVASTPGLRMAPLAIDDGRVELPLWRLSSPGAPPEASPGAREPRRRVFADEASGLDPRVLAPKALMLTALLRLGGCELFIHGTGGGVYDLAAEKWVRAWLGRELAPMAVVTATMRLDLGAAGMRDADAVRAIWMGQSAWHNPGLVGDKAGASEKSRLVEGVVEARASGGDARSAYTHLHEFLKEFRERHKDALAGVNHDMRRGYSALEESRVLNSREWAFPLHHPDSLAALKGRIAEAFRLPAAPR